MSELAPNALHVALHAELHAELRALIASSRPRLAGAANAELTRLYWSVGDQLAQEFGRGFEAKNLRRRVQFAHAFPLPEIVATLSRPLSWSHFVNLLPLKSEPARQFYASQAAANTWSVRELRHPIERKAFERTELAALQAPTPRTTPALIFKDSYFLDFLSLHQGHGEADLEAAILRQLGAFILELGRGFTFVEHQKRMVFELSPSASSSAPNPAANKRGCCKCTKTASPWPNTRPSCHPKQRWSKSCMPLCLKRGSGLRGTGSCWRIWMMNDDMKASKGVEFPIVALPGVGHMPAPGEDEREVARVDWGIFKMRYFSRERLRFLAEVTSTVVKGFEHGNRFRLS